MLEDAAAGVLLLDEELPEESDDELDDELDVESLLVELVALELAASPAVSFGRCAVAPPVELERLSFL